jgi:DNA-binding CsgD family transcriptional regulator
MFFNSLSILKILRSTIYPLPISEHPHNAPVICAINLRLGSVMLRMRQKTVSATFKALADPTRRKILKLLRERDMTAGEIAEQFNISKPSISHHLNILKQSRLVIDNIFTTR